MATLKIFKRNPTATTENAFAPNTTAFVYFLDGSSIQDTRVQIAEQSPFYSALNRTLTPDPDLPEYLADWDYLPGVVSTSGGGAFSRGSYTGSLFKLSGNPMGGYVAATEADATHGSAQGMMGMEYKPLSFWGGTPATAQTYSTSPESLKEKVSNFQIYLHVLNLDLETSGPNIGQPSESLSVKTLTDAIKTLAVAYRQRDSAPISIEV